MFLQMESMRKERIKQEYERFTLDLQNFASITENNVINVLRDNEQTEFGKVHGFSDMHTVEDYRVKMPLTSYEDYADLTERTFEGESNLLTVYPIENYLLTSGTKGKQKRFILTRRACEQYVNFIADAPHYLLDCYEGYQLHTSCFSPPDKYNQTIVTAAYFNYCHHYRHIFKDYYAGGDDNQYVGGLKNLPYLKARIGLQWQHITSIQSIYVYEVLLLLNYIEQNWQMLLSDIENGTFSVPLSDTERRIISELPPVSAERMRELRTVFDDGFDVPIAPRIWKELRFVGGNDGKACGNRTSELRKYIGDIPMHYFTFSSSEVMSTVPMCINKPYYTPLPRSGYYEFVPKDDESTVLTAQEVQLGGVYEFVITTFSGLYRYRTGDYVEVVDFNHGVPVIEVLGRKDHYINIAGEKTDAPTISMALQRLTQQGYKVYDFAAIDDRSVYPARYLIYLETDETDIERMSIALDGVFCDLSRDYCEIRDMGNMGQARICPLPVGFISGNLYDSSVRRHSKPVIILNNDLVERLEDARSKNGI